MSNTSGPERHLSVDAVSKVFGSTTAVDDVTLSIERGQTLSLLGPSGCGKTTILRMIAGLESPDQGSIWVGDRNVAGPGISVPAEKRRVGMVFQGGALFPHMTVGQNVAYGLGRDADAKQRVAASLERVDLGGFEDRTPDSLSGGQAQRVALARALVPQPDLILLDEPFGQLDAELRLRVRTEVASLLRSLDTTALFVTHDQEEAFVVGDTVAVMREGRVLQSGTPSEIYQRPASPWIAEFVGDANVVLADAEGSFAATAIGSVPISVAAQGPCRVVMRPEHLTVSSGGVGTVASVEFYGHDTSYVIELDGGKVTARHISAPQFAIGDAVSVSYSGPETVVFQDES